MTRYELHVSNWKYCTLCELAERRNRIVLFKGSIPADVLFIGEAPGESENVLGRPFAGPAGKLLDKIVDDALGGREVRIGYTNLVACIPYDEDGIKTAEPKKECIKSCFPRLLELVGIVRPRLIVNVGALSKKYVYGQSMFDPVDWIPEDEFIRFLDIIHPAAILRANVANQGLQIQRATVQLSNAFDDL